MPGKRSLWSYIGRRIIESVPLIFGVILITFALIHAAPGDPAVMFAGETGSSPEVLEAIRRSMGLDKPLYVQLYIYVQKVLSLDLGQSIIYHDSVLGIIIPRLANTLLLMGTQWFFACLLGVLVGVFAARRPYSRLDNLAQTVSLLSYSLPTFWLAQITVLVFAIHLNLFPATGITTLRQQFVGLDLVADILYHLALPAATLTAINIALISRLTRSSMLEMRWQDFITTARAKGLSETNILFRHQLRNALLPVVTVSGMSFGIWMAGSVLVETVFAWPGIGLLMLESIGLRDYPVLMGIFVIVSMVVIYANLVTDIVYAFLDPRIRY